MNDDGKIRTFDTGATRDTAEGKLDMEGFTHPMVMKQFAKYMNMNRLQSDGKTRDSDNWQKGISIDAYMKSLKRHCDDVWHEHREFTTESGLIAALCGVMFNAMGYLHEVLKDDEWELQDFDGTDPTPEMEERIVKLAEDRLADKLAVSNTEQSAQQAYQKYVRELAGRADNDIREQLQNPGLLMDTTSSCVPGQPPCEPVSTSFAVQTCDDLMCEDCKYDSDSDNCKQ